MDLHGSTEPSPTELSLPSRRTVLGLALGAALAGLATAANPRLDRPAGALAAARRRRRPKPKPRYKVVTRTFSNSAAIRIKSREPATPYPAAITVSGLRRGKLLDVNITLKGFRHQYPRDVDILLVAPNGLGAIVLSDLGGSEPASGLTILVDDQAFAPPSVLSPLSSGSYRPLNEQDPAEAVDDFPAPAPFTPYVTLSTFTGINPNGTWKLYVYDDTNGDEGGIDVGWSLTIKARVRV